jgi:hypothetical protein
MEQKKSDREYYEEYLKWIEENKFNVWFDPETGVIGVMPGDSFENITTECFPVYGYDKKYLGYVEKGKFIRVGGDKK